MSLTANQHLQVFVSTTGTAVAAADLEALALLPGSIGFLEIATGAVLVAPPVGLFQAAYCDLNGIVHLSQKMDSTEDNYHYHEAIIGRIDTVQHEETLTVPLVVVEGDQYVARIACPEYGGLIGAEDEVWFYGSHTVKLVGGVIETRAEVAAGIAASLQLAVGKAPVPFIDVTAAAGVITFVGIVQPYTQALFDGRHVAFATSWTSPESAWAGGEVTVPGTPGKGTYAQVAVREELYAGYNTFYKNRQADWPRVVQPTLAADPAGLYNLHSFTTRTRHGDANHGTQRQITECYFNVAVVPAP